jgi:folylpolyglutamate synthase/dihydropteroate synthase
MGPTAREQYAANRADALAALDLLRQHIDAADVRAAMDPTNWGYVGDMGRIANRLRELLEVAHV